MEELEKRWKEILQIVKEEMDLTDVKFKTWLKPLTVYSVQDGCVYIQGDFERLGIDYLSLEFMLPLKTAIKEVTGMVYDIKFISPE